MEKNCKTCNKLIKDGEIKSISGWNYCKPCFDALPGIEKVTSIHSGKSVCFKMGYDLLSLLDPTFMTNIIELFIDDYEWIRGSTLEMDEVIEQLKTNPRYAFNAEVCEYGIHGTMVSVTWGSCHWNIYRLVDFDPILDKLFNNNEKVAV